MDESTNIENKKQRRQKPPRSMGRIAGQIVAGTATAAALAYASLFIVGYGGTIAGLGEGCMDGFIVLAMMVYFVPPAYLLGCAIGVYLVGRIGNQTGSLLATLGGVLLGLPVMAILYFYMHVAEDMMLGIEKIILWPLIFTAPAIIATIAFNQTRRYKKPPSP